MLVLLDPGPEETDEHVPRAPSHGHAAVTNIAMVEQGGPRTRLDQQALGLHGLRGDVHAAAKIVGRIVERHVCPAPGRASLLGLGHQFESRGC